MTSKIKRHKNLIPIILLAGICLWTVYEILFVKYEFNDELYDRNFSKTNILAFVSVVIDISIYFFARKYFKTSVIVTIVLAFVGILNFTADTYVVNFILPFQPVALLIGLLYVIINFERVKARLYRPNDINLETAPDLEKVEDFKNKYRQKTIEELVEIVNNRKFIKEAKMAANELLEQKPNS